MARMSPTQRTLRALRQQGCVCDIAEHWKAHAGVTQDLFGFIDIISLDPKHGIVAIQCTDGSNFSKRVHKLLDSEATDNVIAWLACGGKVEVWGWRKLTAKRWEPRVRIITLVDFACRPSAMAAAKASHPELYEGKDSRD